MTQGPKTIPMSESTKRFYQGVATASEVLKAHEDTEFPDHQTRLSYFFFYAGAMAVDEHHCHTSEDFSNFLLGLATRVPQPPEED